MSDVSPPPPTPSEEKATSRTGNSRLRTFVIWGNVAYAVLLVALYGALRLMAESWWPATAALYLPRWPWMLPTIPLGIAAWFVWRQGVWLPIVGALLVLGPIAGLRLPQLGERPRGQEIRVVTLNIQNGKPNLPASLGEIERFEPHLLLCQEVDYEQRELEESAAAAGLVHVRYDSHFWTAATSPLRLVEVVESQTSFRDICAVYEWEGPTEAAGTMDTARQLFVVNVHLSTARHGLVNLRPTSPLTGTGLQELAEHQHLRAAEIGELAATLDELSQRGDVIVAGDFNMPTDSPWFAALLRDRVSAFDVAGRGYGYTVPNDAGDLWPRGVCWLRVDHVLAGGLGVRAARPGRASGSDHRGMFAKLVRPSREPALASGEGSP